jgi:hypothetical protein
MKPEQILKRAGRYVFSTGLNDASAHLSRINMNYGLAKIHCVQEKLGLEPNAMFISSPDETVSRNAGRWEQGISYGGKISWGNGKEKFMILDIKPNCCGMLVGSLKKIPDIKELVKNITALESVKNYIDDVEVKWDFWKSNHFIDVFEVESDSGKLPGYAAIIHTGCPEFKGDNVKGSGLYWNESKILSENCEKFNTPFGMTYVLQGKDVDEYLKLHNTAERFAHKRRVLAFRSIFGGREKDILTNVTHQGLLNMNEAVLGCNYVRNERELLPVSIRADIPSYIMRGKFNFSKEAIEKLGFKERAERLGVYKKLRQANLLPHGGGYTLPESLKVSRVVELKGRRFFEVENLSGLGKNIISNARELPFAYRGGEVVKRIAELDMGVPAATLKPVYTLKI